MKLFAAKKIKEQANNIYREIWETNARITLTKTGYYDDQIRVNFSVPSFCGQYQFFISSRYLIEKFGLWYERAAYIDGDTDLNKIIAGATAETNILGTCRGQVDLSRFSWVCFS